MTVVSEEIKGGGIQAHTGVDARVGVPYRYDIVTDQARDSLSQFFEWSAANNGVIEDHIELYMQHLDGLHRKGSVAHRAARFATRDFFGKRLQEERRKDEVDHFSILNLGELLSEDLVDKAAQKMKNWERIFDEELNAAEFDSPGDIIDHMKRYLPEGYSADDLSWAASRLERLYGILPEFVVREGGMGKVARTMLGVMSIAAFNAKDLDSESRYEHITRSIKPAYFYAVTYPIVDDVLQDSDYVSSKKDKDAYHQAILNGLSSGDDIDARDLPEHPLVEEMIRIYDEMRELFPFEQNRSLYYALESMYLAQHNDTHVDIHQIRNTADLYTPIVLKASLSRIVAHELTGSTLDDEHVARIFGTLIRQQFIDDTRDVADDLRAGRHTPFTLAVTHPELELGNPLFHRFAHEAYIARALYGEDASRASEVLSRFGAYDMVRNLAGNQAHSQFMSQYFGDNPLVKEVINRAAGLDRRVLRTDDLASIDKRLEGMVTARQSERDPNSVDPRTYISDSLEYVNELLLEECAGDEPISKVIHYALEAGGKRVRPALTLMLAESLGINKDALIPLLVSTEFAHTASLIFDDLPAQDGALLRRGRPTAHVAFPEYDAQLAGISMIAHSIGVLGRLGRDFPPARVNEVVEYVGTILGPEKLCLGQHMDLSMGPGVSAEEIIEMYDLKTSTMIEGALVPLMMLAERSEVEVDLVKEYSYHAGIIFQLRDDILDATSTAEVTGKDSGHDTEKQNIVTMLGIEAAQEMLDEHLKQAIGALEKLDFPTTLLENIARYFATRQK